MIGLPATLRVFVAVPPADLRKGYDGLARLAHDALRQDPLSGHFFVFANRRRDRVKIIYWDRDGYAIWMKKRESDSTHSFVFTEIGEPTYYLAGWPGSAGGMDSCSSPSGQRR